MPAARHLNQVVLQGAFSFKAYNGVFSNRISLSFYMYVGKTGWEGTGAQVPDIRISISGDKVREYHC